MIVNLQMFKALGVTISSTSQIIGTLFQKPTLLDTTLSQKKTEATGKFSFTACHKIHLNKTDSIKYTSVYNSTTKTFIAVISKQW